MRATHSFIPRRALAALAMIQLGAAAWPADLSVSISPAADTTIKKSESVSFDCTPSGGCAPYTYSWSFADGTPSSSTDKAPGAVSYSVEGKKCLAKVTVTDSTAPTPLTKSAQANVIVARVDQFTLDSGKVPGGKFCQNESISKDDFVILVAPEDAQWQWESDGTDNAGSSEARVMINGSAAEPKCSFQVVPSGELISEYGIPLPACNESVNNTSEWKEWTRRENGLWPLGTLVKYRGNARFHGGATWDLIAKDLIEPGGEHKTTQSTKFGFSAGLGIAVKGAVPGVFETQVTAQISADWESSETHELISPNNANDGFPRQKAHYQAGIGVGTSWNSEKWDSDSEAWVHHDHGEDGVKICGLSRYWRTSEKKCN